MIAFLKYFEMVLVAVGEVGLEGERRKEKAGVRVQRSFAGLQSIDPALKKRPGLDWSRYSGEGVRMWMTTDEFATIRHMHLSLPITVSHLLEILGTRLYGCPAAAVERLILAFWESQHTTLRPSPS